jgi:polyisoprenoid-binding protein YceI
VLVSAIQLSASTSSTERPLTAKAQAQANAAITFLVAPDGNAARYRVREQLAGFDLPNDAVGETRDVTGSIGLDKAGNVIAEASRITVKVDSLKSDKDRRDGYIRRRVLEVDKFPSVELNVTGIQGVKLPVPKSGSRAFTLVGNLTIHGVTRPTTWTANATFADSVVTGKATTKFTFADFQLTQPKVPIVLSVADTIALEYDFKLLRAKAGK